jgi:hypothetical protein
MRLPNRQRTAVAMAMTRHRTHRQRWLPVLSWLRRPVLSWTPGWLDQSETDAGELLTGSHRRTHRHRRVRRALGGSIAAVLLPPSIILIDQAVVPAPVAVSVSSHPGHVQPVPPR